MLTLYQFPISHYCEKIRWALDYKQLDYQVVNLLPGFHAATAKKLSRRSSVPILRHNDKVVRNSSDIISYLDETFPEHSLIPVDTQQKQDALDWERFADKEIGPYVRRICYHTLLEYPALVVPLLTVNGPWVIRVMFPGLRSKMRKLMDINEASTQIAQQHLAHALDKLHAHLQGRTYFVGNRFSRADLAVASLLAPLYRPTGYGLDWPQRYPKPLARFTEGLSDRLAWGNLIYERHR